jgi:hypothetical protein
VGIVVTGFALVTSLWVLHFHRVAGRWGISDANCAQEGQSHAAKASGLTPTNIFQLAGFVNLISQNDAVGTLAIAEPHRVFYEFFPARHRYYVERFIPWDLIYDDRYTGELFREYLRVFPGTYVRQVRDALMFNLTHRATAGASIFRYPDVEDILTFQRTRPYPIVPAADGRAAALVAKRTLTWPEAEVLLTQMTAAPAPAHSMSRSVHLGVNRVALMLWGAITVLAGLGALACLAAPGYRSCVILALHALVLAGAPAVLGMAADRYALVGEAALYVLVALLLSFTVSRRVRRCS